MEKKQLSNGMRVVMKKNLTYRSVTFGIWVKVGSRYESILNNGISHFIEHMLFKGTDKFSAKQIAEIFDTIGGHVNAFTSKEYTCYYAKVLDEHLEIAIQLLSDMYLHSTLDTEELEKEKKVILEEIAMYEDTPDEAVHDLAAKAAYGQHPLASPILGTADILKKLNREDLLAYMAEHYTVENTIISIVGNIPDAIIDLLEKYFGDFKNKKERAELSSPSFESQTLSIERSTEQNHICLSFPTCKYQDPRNYAMLILNNYIGGGMSSLLFQEIREKRGLAYSIYSYYSGYVDTGLFTIYAGTLPQQTSDVISLTFDVLKNLKQKGLTAEELEKGKEQLKGNTILNLENVSSQMNQIAKNEIFQKPHVTMDELIARIEAVSLQDIQEVVELLFSEPCAIATVGKETLEIEKLKERSFCSKSM